MKKLIVILLALTVALSLTACFGEPAENPTEAPTETPTDAPTETPTDAPTEPHTTHTPAEDDGDCTTAVFCLFCPEIVLEAKDAHDFTNKPAGNAEGHIYSCSNDGCTAQSLQKSHEGGEETCEKGKICTACDYEYTDALGHDVAYDILGLKFTVSCKRGCGYEGSVFLREPESYVYTGQRIEYIPEVVGEIEYTVTYSAPPIDVGEYTVTLAVGSESRTSYFKIEQAMPEYTAPEDMLAYVGQQLKDIPLPEGFTWYDESIVLTKTGRQTFHVNYTPADTKNYYGIGTGVWLNVRGAIRTTQDLQEAFRVGGYYTLMNDLDIGEVSLDTDTETISIDLDLGGHTLKTGHWAGIYVDSDVTLKMYNGTVEQTNDECAALTSYGTVVVTDCTLIGKNYYALYICDNTAAVKNVTLEGGVYVSNSYTDAASLVAAENVVISACGTQWAEDLISINEKGVATFGFDPSNMLEKSSNCTVRDNGDGTWTVYVEPVGDPLIEALYLSPGTAEENDELDPTYRTFIVREGQYFEIGLRGQHLDQPLTDQRYIMGSTGNIYAVPITEKYGLYSVSKDEIIIRVTYEFLKANSTTFPYIDTFSFTNGATQAGFALKVIIVVE